MKLKINETSEHLDLEMIKNNFIKLNEFKKIASANMPKDMKELMKTRIQNLRSELKNCSTKLFQVHISNGRETYWEMLEKYPTPTEIKGAVSTFKTRVGEIRKSRRNVQMVDKEVLGFRYKMQGDVFLEGNTILKMMENANPIERVRRIKKPHDKMKSNYVGVEIEFICKCDRDVIETLLIQAGLAGYARVGTDSSINREVGGEYTFEITCLFRETETKTILTKLCKVLNHGAVGAYVNNSCGLHVHMDARNRDHKMMYNNLVKCLPLLSSMVPNDRIKGNEGRTHYCKLNTQHEFDKGIHDGRYQAINPEAYNKYKTIEIRLHSGSTNANKIINWVTILSGIANLPTKIESSVSTTEELGCLFDVSGKLAMYINKRIELFKTKTIVDTRADHFSSIEYDAAV